MRTARMIRKDLGGYKWPQKVSNTFELASWSGPEYQGLVREALVHLNAA